MSLSLHSEYGTPKTVITHRPGPEIERLSPYNTSELLFEDVPYLEVMQKEHDEFTNLIRETTGANVFRLHDLLVEVLINDKILTDIFKQEFGKFGLEKHIGDIIFRYSTSECASILIAGIKVKELRQKYNNPVLDKMNPNDYLIQPCPNQYFMRDPAAVVQNGVICSQMKYASRQRESNLVRLIFENHKNFKDSFHQIYPTPDMNGNIPSIEGGDVVVLSGKSLAIGSSERTDSEAIKKVAQQLLKDESVERVYEVDLPPKRNFMHLDTVFTIIDENLVVTYPDAMDSVLRTNVYRKKGEDGDGNVILDKEVIDKSITDVLQEEIKYLEVIQTGAGNPDFSSREQWYDGANVFAIGPRRVISYNRNKFTNRALREAGVEVVETSSSELSRGLGGPRCMTLPLERQVY